MVKSYPVLFVANHFSSPSDIEFIYIGGLNLSLRVRNSLFLIETFLKVEKVFYSGPVSGFL